VVGVPDAEWGQRVLAVVQAAPGVHTDEAAARRILEHCRSRLARFKMPGEIRFWERLPRTETGKINRSKIRDDVLAGHAT
jgi:acyl-coenzyme A synthetase/AMP-(fatty) acid ligase